MRAVAARFAAGGAMLALAAALGGAASRRVTPPVRWSDEIRYRDDAGVVRQHGTADCGVAVVAMLLDRSGARIDAGALWREARPDPRGLTLADLMSLAGTHGIRLRHVFQHPGADRRSLATPWIAHLAWQHYVLVEADDGTSVTVADPRAGRYTFSARAFAAAWSGHGLVRVSP